MNPRIAVPVAKAVLSSHFGQCEAFALFDVDADTKTISNRQDVTPPDHAPGVFPQWLAEQRVTLILAGGMGGRAQDLFAEHGIQVILGVAPVDPETAATSYLAGQLVAGDNPCNHGDHQHTCSH